jgi:proteasome lid subunit RPN8/RPN11
MPLSRVLRWRSPEEEEEGSEPLVSIFVSQHAFVRFCAHAGSDLDNEVGGWLVGRWRVDRKSEKQFIVVDNVLHAPYTRQGSAFLTFTQDSQVALYEALGERFPGKDLVGWYHTHPRMGVFLSEYDTWLHRNFFPEHYQVALVIEPHAAIGGFFVRQPDGELDPRRYYGFYELYYRKRRSVVHWRNIFPEAEVISGG